jgi:hypothetical protein
MVQGTRSTPSGFGASGSGQLQQPPPLPNLAEVMASQTKLLRQFIQGQQAFQQFQQQWGGHNVHQPHAAGYLDFLVFSSLYFTRRRSLLVPFFEK